MGMARIDRLPFRLLAGVALALIGLALGWLWFREGEIPSKPSPRDTQRSRSRMAKRIGCRKALRVHAGRFNRA